MNKTLPLPLPAGAAAALCLACLTFAVPPVAAKDLVPLQTFRGTMPLDVPPLLQPAITSAAGLADAWKACRVAGTPPAIDFRQRLVLVATNQSSVVSFQRISLDDGNLKTNVAVTPDMPGHRTCAFAVVPRAGVKSVNGVALAQR